MGIFVLGLAAPMPDIPVPPRAAVAELVVPGVPATVRPGLGVVEVGLPEEPGEPVPVEMEFGVVVVLGWLWSALPR
ncbi:hypothetical protein [Nocardia sp. NPDC049707]|uniref:hypothetical protein n=1 Tax=Nocardia sp. NPDC049707 TaxID=3154735 RepID=UPI00344A8D59